MDLNQPHRQSRRSSGHPESGDQPLVPATGKFVEMSMEKLHMIVVAFLGPERSTQNPGAQSFNSACYADYR
ncbi:no significant blast hit [Histoplasma capsulatum var. duboisii H88]|nr:no significant blast hit [Histoplasma capsulatum var. duboisii H88]